MVRARKYSRKKRRPAKGGVRKAKRACKPRKGKARARRVNGRCVSYGAKGARVSPGTKRGDAYCARSYAQMKKYGSTPAIAASRKRWKCSGKRSRR